MLDKTKKRCYYIVIKMRNKNHLTTKNGEISMKNKITKKEIEYVLTRKYLTGEVIRIMYKYEYSQFITSCYCGLLPRQYVLRKFKEFLLNHN